MGSDKTLSQLIDCSLPRNNTQIIMWKKIADTEISIMFNTI